MVERSSGMGGNYARTAQHVGLETFFTMVCGHFSTASTCLADVIMILVR
jgi:hypothetical protein